MLDFFTICSRIVSLVEEYSLALQLDTGLAFWMMGSFSSYNNHSFNRAIGVFLSFILMFASLNRFNQHTGINKVVLLCTLNYQNSLGLDSFFVRIEVEDEWCPLLIALIAAMNLPESRKCAVS